MSKSKFLSVDTKQKVNFSTIYLRMKGIDLEGKAIPEEGKLSEEDGCQMMLNQIALSYETLMGALKEYSKLNGFNVQQEKELMDYLYPDKDAVDTEVKRIETEIANALTAAKMQLPAFISHTPTTTKTKDFSKFINATIG